MFMRYILICLSLFLICSCTIRRKLYTSTYVNNPSLQHKNDYAFSASISQPAGFDFSGGYAVTNRLAILAGAHTYRNAEDQTDDDFLSPTTTEVSLLYRHKGYHGGLGVYFPISKKNSNGYASFFTGYIKDDFRMDEDGIETDNNNGTTVTRDLFYKSDIGRYFVSGGIHAYVGQFDLSFLGRYNYVEYSNIVTNYSTTEQQLFNFPTLGYSKNSQFLDFAFDMKYYFTEKPRIGLQFFGLLTARLNQKEFNFPFFNNRIGVGVVIRNPFQKSE